jgi:hypothetical protein
MDRLNKPQEHVVNGKLVRSYADGRTEITDLPAPTTPGGSTRYSISPKDYTPESLKKYAESNNVGDLVAVKGAATDNLATPGGADFTKTGDDFLGRSRRRSQLRQEAGELRDRPEDVEHARRASARST